MEGPERGELESIIEMNPTRSKVEGPMNESNIFLDELWLKTMDASNGSDQICQLRTCFGCEASWGCTTCANSGQVIPILQVIQGLICFGIYAEHQVRLEALSIN
jgi:hypothetical protein